MSFLELFILAIALSVDSLAVSAGFGTSVKKQLFEKSVLLGICFGVSHMIAILLGWWIGEKFSVIITSTDHWIAFGLLTIIGIRMIIGFFGKQEMNPKIFQWKTLFPLCLATSIDAVGVGLSFAFFPIHVFRAMFLIGVVVWIISFLGMTCGANLQKYIGRKAEFVGGLVLIVIGIRILIEHLN